MSFSSSTPPIFFWRPSTPPHAYMSQWYISPFTIPSASSSSGKDETYETAEMWMMIGKARLFGDEEIAAKMLKTNDPAEHQRLGRKVKGFERGKWDDHKLSIVEEGSYHKFTKSTDFETLKQKLLATGDAEIVEASPKDRIWGVGYGAEDAEANRKDWGENLLGIALMRVRERLRNEGEGSK